MGRCSLSSVRVAGRAGCPERGTMGRRMPVLRVDPLLMAEVIPLADRLAAKRGCPLCVRSWRIVLLIGLGLAAVAAVALAWHRGGGS